MSDFTDRLLSVLGNQTKDGDGCVVCGAPDISREDIFPKWLQKRFGLANLGVLRPSNTKMQYPKFLVSLCFKCNNEHFSQLENRIAASSISYENALTSSLSDFHLWLTKIYYFVQLFEQSRQVHVELGEKRSLVSEKQIFDAHLLQIILKSAIPNQQIVFPEQATASLWLFQASANWGRNFDFACSGNQNIIAMRLGDLVLLAVVGDWAQYKVRVDLNNQKKIIDQNQFHAYFELLKYLVEKNGISPSFSFSGSLEGSTFALHPLPILAQDLDTQLDDQFQYQIQSKYGVTV